MNEVEHVATWVGLFLAIAGIVLSIVAVTFTWVVNGRAEKLNDQTIRALATIERDVRQVSDDTKGLIRDAFTKMLGGHQIQAIAAEAEAEMEEAHAEVQAAVTDVPPEGAKTDSVEQVRLERDSLREVVGRLERAVRRLQESGSGGGSYPEAIELLRRVSPEARELVRIIYTSGPLTASQVTQLNETLVEPLIDELKDVRVLRRILRISRDSAERQVISVLTIPSVLRNQVRSALRLFDHNEATEATLRAQLSAVGYPGSANALARYPTTPSETGDSPTSRPDGVDTGQTQSK